jgi:hypothetical protein
LRIADCGLRIEDGFNRDFANCDSNRRIQNKESAIGNPQSAIHNHMRLAYFTPLSLIHGMMNFDAKWRGDIMSDLKQKPVAIP